MKLKSLSFFHYSCLFRVVKFTYIFVVYKHYAAIVKPYLHYIKKYLCLCAKMIFKNILTRGGADIS